MQIKKLAGYTILTILSFCASSLLVHGFTGANFLQSGIFVFGVVTTYYLLLLGLHLIKSKGEY